MGMILTVHTVDEDMDTDMDTTGTDTGTDMVRTTEDTMVMDTTITVTMDTEVDITMVDMEGIMVATVAMVGTETDTEVDTVGMVVTEDMAEEAATTVDMVDMVDTEDTKDMEEGTITETTCMLTRQGICSINLRLDS